LKNMAACCRIWLQDSGYGCRIAGYDCRIAGYGWRIAGYG
jgi:hypothetical protein